MYGSFTCRSARHVPCSSPRRVYRVCSTGARRSPLNRGSPARNVQVGFQTGPFPTWAPTVETIDERDRQKAVDIQLRFEDADSNQDGRIDQHELRALLETTCSGTVPKHLMQHWLSEEEVARVMARYDLDHSGDLDRQEFEMLVADGLLLDEKLADYKKAFDAADTDGNGVVSAQELMQLLQRLGWSHELSLRTALEMIGKYDSDENGCLNFTEFMSLMKTHMLDVSEVLAYVGARPQSPTTTRTVVEAVAHHDFRLVMSEEELDAILKVYRHRLVVLFAGATWCGSCRATVQSTKTLADAYPGVVFLMLWGNVNDASKKLFRDRLKVRSTPAFFLFRDSDLVLSFAGSNPARLEAEIRRRCLPEEIPGDAVYSAALQAYE